MRRLAAKPRLEGLRPRSGGSLPRRASRAAGSGGSRSARRPGRARAAWRPRPAGGRGSGGGRRGRPSRRPRARRRRATKSVRLRARCSTSRDPVPRPTGGGNTCPHDLGCPDSVRASHAASHLSSPGSQAAAAAASVLPDRALSALRALRQARPVEGPLMVTCVYRAYENGELVATGRLTLERLPARRRRGSAERPAARRPRGRVRRRRARARARAAPSAT